jgi:nucleotide-binding universal stress UspA family protein
MTTPEDRLKASGSMTIVVAYDGSDAARRALAEAARRAGIGGKVLIVHAYHSPPDWIGRPDYQRILSTRRGRGEALLAEAAADPALASVLVETDLLGGHPADAILAADKAHDAQEIVLGSRGLGPARAALGSVGLRVLHSTDRPVLIVPALAARTGV